MKGIKYLIWTYAVILLIGGMIGFVKAGSIASITTSSLFAGFLFYYGNGIEKGVPYAYRLTIGNLVCILAFFIFRFFSTYSFMPAGMMIILTILVLGYLWAKKPLVSS